MGKYHENLKILLEFPMVLYYNISVMKNFLLILSLILIFPASDSFSEEAGIESKIMSVDPEQEFFIIKAGSDEGIELGDEIIVHKGLAKIANAYVVEVRRNVSAAEVLNISQSQGGEIQEGDNVIIYKEKAKKIHTKEKAKEWTYLGPKSERGAIAERPGSPPQARGYRKGYPAEVTINKDPETVFSYASLVLKEDSYLITSSDRGIGVLLAYKPISLSLIRELWADATAKIDHRLTLSLNMTGNKNSTKLVISAFREHTQKEKHIKVPIVKNSRYYSDLADIAVKIKERSEH